MKKLNSIVIDVSKYQTGINWPKVAASGVLAVIIKATQGLNRDPLYASHLAGAASQNLLPGHYCFGTGDASGAAQADFFLSVVKPGKNDLLVLDWENAKTKRNPFAKSMTSQQAVDFINRIFEKTGRWPVVYTAAWWTIPNLKREHWEVMANCALWLTGLVSQARLQIPHPWKDWSIWQYTNGEVGLTPRSVPGVPVYCDRNFWDGDEAGLRDFWDGDTPTPTLAHPVEAFASLPEQTVDEVPNLMPSHNDDDPGPELAAIAGTPAPAAPVAAPAPSQPAVEVKQTQAMSPVAKIGAWLTAAGTTIYGFFSAHSDQVQAVASTQTGTQALAGALATFFHLLPFIIPAALIAGYIGYKEWLAHDRLKAVVATTADQSKQSVVIT